MVSQIREDDRGSARHRFIASLADPSEISVSLAVRHQLAEGRSHGAGVTCGVTGSL